MNTVDGLLLFRRCQCVKKFVMMLRRLKRKVFKQNVALIPKTDVTHDTGHDTKSISWSIYF